MPKHDTLQKPFDFEAPWTDADVQKLDESLRLLFDQFGGPEGLEVFNADTTSLSHGMLVYLSGGAGSIPSVKRADSDADGTMPAIGFVNGTILKGGTGFVLTTGTLTDIDTSSETVGALLYVSGTAGRFTSTAPSARIQVVGNILLKNKLGSIYIDIQGQGETHALLSGTHDDSTAATVVRGDLVTGQGATATWSRLALGAAGTLPRSDGTDLVYSTFTLADTYVAGDLLHATATSVVSGLADIATGNALISGGVGAVPTYGKIALTTHISGVLPIANGGTNQSSAFTAGSVIFSDGTRFVQDNAKLFWDDTNNRLGIGTTTPADELHVVGHVDIDHVADAANEHSLEIEVDAAGFGNIQGINMTYVTGAIAAGKDEEAILVVVDESSATGGTVVGLEVLATEGSADIVAIEAGALVAPIFQLSGTFSNMDSALVKTTDRLTEFLNAGNDIIMFVDDTDTVTVGDAAKFEELEFLLATGASGAGIKPKFEFSTGASPTTYTEFFPADGTNAMRNTGVIAWELADVATWAVDASNEFLIRITRQRANLTTKPVESKVQIAIVEEFGWDKDANVTIDELRLLEPSGGGLSYTGFTAPALAGNVIYTLPTADGSANEVLTTDGSLALSWTAAVTTISGTPANNQLAIWTGASTLEGDSNLTWDGSNLYIATTTAPTGTGGLIFGDGTVLSSMGSNTAGIFADDVSGTVMMHAITEAGDGGVIPIVNGVPVNNQIVVWSNGVQVEGDSKFLWDGSVCSIGVGAATTSVLNVLATDALVLQFGSTSAGGDGPSIRCFHDSSSPADGDDIFNLFATANDSGATERELGLIRCRFSDVTSTEMDSTWLFLTSNAVNAGGVNTTASLTNDGVWTDASDAKAKFYEAAISDVLQKISQLETRRYRSAYVKGKKISTSARHAGPTAQGFYDLFGLGADPSKPNAIPGIAAKDLAAVALAGIKELIARVEILEQETT